MTHFWIELSGENPALAEAEVRGAVRAVGGRLLDRAGSPILPNFLVADLADNRTAAALSGRLALARRILVSFVEGSIERGERAFAQAGAEGRSAEFRQWGSLGRRLDQPVALRWVDAYRRGGGQIDLSRPGRRFLVQTHSESEGRAFEEVAVVDRGAFGRRAMPHLPFRRPVSLPPRLARVAVNLASVKPLDRVVDPFVGTGALLMEAGLVGARISGVDRDPEMVRGALRNLAAVGVDADELAVRDAGDAFSPVGGAWDALVTDPPYGRASGSGGELPSTLVARVLPTWAERVRPGGRVVVVLPGGPDPLGPPWHRVESVAQRVHRSLTREFRVYEREPSGRDLSGL